MSYCLNPDCQKPHNTSDAKFCLRCGSKLLLFDRYRAIEPLGAGGFGRTFLALDELKPSKPRCVIKQFFPQDRGFINSVKAAELFRSEAVRLDVLGKHPQIPELLAHLEQGPHQYLVQEFIDGRNLGDELADKGAFNETQIRQLLDDLLPVLQFIHSNQVIHRDIKPENIIRRRSDGQLFLVDFGAAKFVNKTSLQNTGTAIGSAAYTAPEQLMGKAVFASDVYSLGVTCVHLMTQIPPFDLFDSREGTWAWRDYLGQLISYPLGQVLDKMLEPAINRRYLSAAQVLKALNPPPLPGPGSVKSAPPALPAAAKAVPQVAGSLAIQNRRTEIQKTLQEALNAYNVKVQVNLAKTQLTLVINRPEDTAVNYSEVSKIVSYQLTALQLKGVDKIKAFGRIEKQNAPEWKQMFQVTQPPQASHSSRPDLPGKANQNFWLAIFDRKNFWLDSLMFFMVVFIFNRIVIFNSLTALVISSAFLVVKNALNQTKGIKNERLFKELGLASVLVGLWNQQIFINDAFGLLLAGIFLALPFLYVYENIGED